MSTSKDFEIPIPQPLKDRLDRAAAEDGQATTAFARSLIIEGLRDREQHAMDLARYQSKTDSAPQKTPQKPR